MSQITKLVYAVVFSAILAFPAMASDGRDRHGRGWDDGHRSPPSQYQRDQGRHYGRDVERGRHDAGERRQYDRRYEHRRHTYPYKGYRVHPHGRYDYHPYRHRERDYHYEGHWMSWNDWERYKRRYPQRFSHGRYYRDHDNRLFFRFCDPEGNACLYYSIGR